VSLFTQRRMDPNNQPQRHFTHRMESESKRAFEAAIDPFVVTWPQSDYGLDAHIDIARFHDDSGTALLEGRPFYAQLKAQERPREKNGWLTYPVKVSHLHYWATYEAPVMFVLYSMETKVCHYRWIDRELISFLEVTNPGWANQKTVTIRIPSAQVIDQDAQKSISAYVATLSKRGRRGVRTDSYFPLLNRSKDILAEFKAISLPFGFKSVAESIIGMEEAMNLSIFRVAITGLSRTGKSSLVNALLGKKVSPTGFYQTTGVPIQVIPGPHEEVKVAFSDGKEELILPLEEEEIKRYASQDFNTDNQMNVSMVTISVVNSDLERGVSLYDIPGLDDPSDEITAYTMQTLSKVDAIIYVIDASAANFGGYIFRKEYKITLDDLAKRKDKVFVVMNKADTIQPQWFRGLRERFVQDLKRHGLADRVHSHIFYLSAEGNASENELDRIEVLSDALWDYILQENKFGIWRLHEAIQKVHENCRSFAGIVNARSLDDKTRKALKSELDKIKSRIPKLVDLVIGRKSKAKQTTLELCIGEKGRILSEFEKWLRRFHVDKPLPSEDEVKKFLFLHLQASIERIGDAHSRDLKELTDIVRVWFESNLKDIHDLLSNEKRIKSIEFPELDDFKLPSNDLHSAWSAGLLSAILTLMFTPGFLAALFVGVVGFLTSLFSTKAMRRANRIQKILDQSRTRFDAVFDRLQSVSEKMIDKNTAQITDKVSKYLKDYFDDLNAQMNLIDVQLTEKEVVLYKETPDKIDKLVEKIRDLDTELRSFQY
jgi:GTPase Era involved in 16S rRNA processing/gas vesicle protein